MHFFLTSSTAHHDLNSFPTRRSSDLAVGAELIAPWVPERVAWCVRMHADAKRYLCATEPDYFGRLSAVSRHTLRLQGGVMAAAEIARLAGHPWLAAALALRRWDDDAKVVGK